MSLTEFGIKNLKFEKRTMVRDDRGLYLIVHPNGNKFWKYRYKEDGKEKKISLGEYPHVSLRDARQKRDEVERNIALGYTPVRKESVPQSKIFKDVALEWFETKIKGVCKDSHADTVIYRLERFLFPKFGARPINEIMPMELLELLRSMQSTGIIETSHRVKQIVGQVFRFGIASGLCGHDITADLRGALKPKKPKHHGAVTTPNEIKGLLKAMTTYQGSYIINKALWFSAYTFARPGEIRHAEWKEIDLELAEWRILAGKMKMKRQHVVPLAKQVVELLRDLYQFSGHGRFLFPGARNVAKGDRPICENAVVAALRRMGFEKEEMTAHGFRSMASTSLNENGFNSDVIERQLAHIERNSVRAAYNYADYLPERRKMMQWWADHIDSLVQ